MGDVSSDLKLMVLRRIWADLQKQSGDASDAVTLASVLTECLAAAEKVVNGGAPVQNTSGAGRSVGLQFLQEHNPVQGWKVFGELCNLLEDVLAAGAASDAEAFAAMKLALRTPPRSGRFDFTYLRESCAFTED